MVLGRGGAGKSSLARELGERTSLPVIEPDMLFWRRGLTAADPIQWTASQRELVPLENRIRPVTCRSFVRHAACVYSLIRPLRIGFRRICCAPMSVTAAGCASRSLSGTCWAMPWCGRAVL